MLGVRRIITLRKAVSAVDRAAIVQATAPAVSLFLSKRCGGTKSTAPRSEESGEAAAAATTTTAPAAMRIDDDKSHGSSLYLPFMGASSRFTFASPISALADITTLESERLTHHPPQRVSDHCCIYLVKLLRWLADKLFRERYLHRATMLKVVAPAPPLAGAMVNYFRMMLKKEDSAYVPRKGSFATETRGLLAQAESHASHVQILMQMTEITYVERVAAIFLQVVHFTVFVVLFLVSPRMAFRLMGYLGEESVVIWTHMINDIDFGKVSERAVPQAAIDYWGLHQLKHVKASTADATKFAGPDQGLKEVPTGTQQQTSDASEEEVTLRDVMLLLRSDEMVWREACHQVASAMEMKRKKSFISSFLS
ncbi:GTPase activating protein of Rab-like GTPase [Trypanosoma rangeli]|uniref:Alternative oxidase n=1 Tax=Trypanosoma rangeli TaxID=5698 RepID=A0A422P567_TRYRA|nr:GTPase activating protein of Rab-like GTPase [Trypanosoma rangeli]RNF12860.1 GTPase activating protein of Rab-like GTPase [Trypanosoma rangeli]|eukprot:RNF12860.1 GTPase activating protein of Rab-like GTPase [Trypanosoma rangeli]